MQGTNDSAELCRKALAASAEKRTQGESTTEQDVAHCALEQEMLYKVLDREHNVIFTRDMDLNGQITEALTAAAVKSIGEGDISKLREIQECLHTQAAIRDDIMNQMAEMRKCSFFRATGHRTSHDRGEERDLKRRCDELEDGQVKQERRLTAALRPDGGGWGSGGGGGGGGWGGSKPTADA